MYRDVKTDDMGERYISYFHCRVRVNVCNSEFLQRNRLNTPVKKSSLDRRLHVYGCLEREKRLTSYPWRNDRTEFHFLLCTFLYCLNFLSSILLTWSKDIKVIKIPPLKSKNKTLGEALRFFISTILPCPHGWFSKSLVSLYLLLVQYLK